MRRNFIVNFLLIGLFLSAVGYSILDRYCSVIEFDLDSKNGNYSKLYWSKNGVAFDEAQSVIKSANGAVRNKRFRFVIWTTDFELIALRPIDSTVKYTVNKITLMRGLSWQTWNRGLDFKAWTPLQNISRYRTARRGVTITPSAVDNYITITLPEKEINLYPIGLAIFLSVLLLYSAERNNFTIPSFISRPLVALHWAGAISYLVSMTYRAAVEFQGSYDYLFYHMPFALMNVHKTTYIPHDMLTSVYAGHPPLSHYIQGIFYLLTGSINSLQLNNPFGVIILLSGIYLLNFSTFSFRWFVTAIFAIPLVVLHFRSGVTDLIGGCSICLCFAAVLKLSMEPGYRFKTVFIALVACAYAMLIKFQTWPTVFIIVVLFSWLLVKNQSKIQNSIQKP